MSGRKYSRADIDALRDLYWSGAATMRELAILTGQAMIPGGGRQTGWISQAINGTRSRYDGLRDRDLLELERDMRGRW